MKRLQIGIMVLASCVMFSCVSSAQLARERAEREYGCRISEKDVMWVSSGPNDYEIYKVKACKRAIATYACRSSDGSCVRESDDR